mmetsp:Transcript_11005/g.13248  ORF Transcript_11005/g.13248 Transcript_11005/m.13248 type:complete len:144 (-) Transcript_11005:30-461(-)
MDEQAVKDRLIAFHGAWMDMSYANGERFDEWWDEYFAKECQGIMRSSGNPLPKEMWRKMISSDDVVYEKNSVNKLVSIDSFIGFANGQAAITTMTVDLIFAYKGTRNEDRARITITWTLCSDEHKWKIVFFQRATGQPIPKEE